MDIDDGCLLFLGKIFSMVDNGLLSHVSFHVAVGLLLDISLLDAVGGAGLQTLGF